MLLKLCGLVVIVGIAWRIFSPDKQLPPVIEGFFQPQYRRVAELFRKYVEDGTERGGSFAVFQHGEPLIDLWGGYADPDSKRPWQENTITMVWSCTKGVSALAVAMLVKKGLLDYKAEVRQYWPEFGQNGKHNITVEMLLSHQAGLVSLGNKTVALMEYKNDWQKMEQLMVSAAPDFPPGSRVAYQAFTYGMYVDALIRKVDPLHRNLTQFFQEDIAKPYGIEFYIGLPPQQYYRTTRQTFISLWAWLPLFFDPIHQQMVWVALTSSDSLLKRAIRVLNFMDSEIEILNDPRQMEVGLGSLMGFGAARSLAKMYSILASGGTVGDKVMLPKALVDTFSVSLTDSLPVEIETPNLVFSRGFQISKNVKGDSMFGHSGYGGQHAFADPKNKLGFSYTTNFMWSKSLTPPDHYQELERLFYECFEQKD